MSPVPMQPRCRGSGNGHEPSQHRLIMPKIVFSKGTSDTQVAMLGERGYFASYISDLTGLSVGQVRARLRRAGIKISDYRKGEGNFAELVTEITKSTSIQKQLELQILQSIKVNMRSFKKNRRVHLRYLKPKRLKAA